jgi:nicotinate-nucleotide pyrophosphorylase (carboxylating)
MDAARLIKEALAEDLGRDGDVTTRFFVPAKAVFSGCVRARTPGVICGTKIAERVFRTCAPGCTVKILVRDGKHVRTGQAVMKVKGGRGLLSAERTALNFLQHLSGIATFTNAFVSAVRGTKAKILDTRKTLPGWRTLEKYAVRCGGGQNHRMGLYDAVMVKDNHWLRPQDFAAATAKLRSQKPKLPMILEADDFAQAQRAAALGADVILLDNMNRGQLRRCIAWIRQQAPKTKIEISGGIDLRGVRALARLGADRISIGRITHSAPALDLGLDLR